MPEHADTVALQKVVADLFEAARNFRIRYWNGQLVAGDDDWLKDALDAYQQHNDGDPAP